MSLPVDALLDRIQLKKRLRRWQLLSLLFLALAALAVFGLPRGHFSPAADYIARLPVEGVIEDNPELYELIDEIKEDDQARAVILWVNSPGGTSVGGEQLYHELRELAEHKPVVAVLRTMATSAGYMIALGSDRIFAREGTITGSVGVLLQTAEITEMAEKLGITPITVKSGPLKASPSPLEKFDDAQRAALQEAINRFYAYFVNLVGERRNLKGAALSAVSDGRVFTGRQALETGLIDAIGGEKEAETWLVNHKQLPADLPVIEVTLKEDKLEGFLGTVQGMAREIGAKMGTLPSATGLQSLWSL